MKVLVLNSGSSSVKFQFIRMDGRRLSGQGHRREDRVERRHHHLPARGQEQDPRDPRGHNHEVAIEIVLSLLRHPQHGVIRDKAEIAGIGHRVVHGGEDSPARC